MSNQFESSRDVPTAMLCDRLDQLADAVTKGAQGHSELSMRVPAEVDRDADLVIAEAARRLREREQAGVPDGGSSRRAYRLEQIARNAFLRLNWHQADSGSLWDVPTIIHHLEGDLKAMGCEQLERPWTAPTAPASSEQADVPACIWPDCGHDTNQSNPSPGCNGIGCPSRARDLVARLITAARAFILEKKVYWEDVETLIDLRHLLKSIEAATTAPAGDAQPQALPIETAPRDGTLVRLLVRFDEHAIDDGEGPFWTIGHNSSELNDCDEWQFAGWCWTHDHFTAGAGTPVGWLPFHAVSAFDAWDAYLGLRPATADLVHRFADALADKLAAAERKYGYRDDWLRPDWMDECRQHLREHLAKGDPRDVAAYCAFLWHHGESTAPAGNAIKAPEQIPWDDSVRSILSKPNFTLIHLANLLRKDGYEVAHRSEDEQAVCLHWMLNLYLKHGADWGAAAMAEIERISSSVKSEESRHD